MKCVLANHGSQENCDTLKLFDVCQTWEGRREKDGWHSWCRIRQAWQGCEAGSLIDKGTEWSQCRHCQLPQPKLDLLINTTLTHPILPLNHNCTAWTSDALSSLIGTSSASEGMCLLVAHVAPPLAPPQVATPAAAQCPMTACRASPILLSTWRIVFMSCSRGTKVMRHG